MTRRLQPPLTWHGCESTCCRSRYYRSAPISSESLPRAFYLARLPHLRRFVGHANHALPTTVATTTLTSVHLTPRLQFVSDLLQIPNTAYTRVRRFSYGPPDHFVTLVLLYGWGKMIDFGLRS